MLTPMPDLDIFVPIPQTIPSSGDNVLYSNVLVDPGTTTASRPAVVGPIQSGELAMKTISGWFKANQDATVKVESWDPVTKAWVTINNNGAGDAAPTLGGPADITAVIPAGAFKIVVNFAVAPTVWSVAKKWRLSRS
jgi:hypothetical protein